MRKDNKVQQKTLDGQMFPQTFPHAEKGGETNLEDVAVQMPAGLEPVTNHTNDYQQSSLQEIWGWFGDVDKNEE